VEDGSTSHLVDGLDRKISRRVDCWPSVFWIIFFCNVNCQPYISYWMLYYILYLTWFFGRPFLKRFTLCYQTIVCPVCDVGVLWPKGWMDQDATWCGGRPQPRRYYFRWGPSSPQRKGAQPPTFRPVSVVAKRSPMSATAELLLCRLQSLCVLLRELYVVLPCPCSPMVKPLGRHVQ